MTARTLLLHRRRPRPSSCPHPGHLRCQGAPPLRARCPQAVPVRWSERAAQVWLSWPEGLRRQGLKERGLCPSPQRERALSNCLHLKLSGLLMGQEVSLCLRCIAGQGRRLGGWGHPRAHPTIATSLGPDCVRVRPHGSSQSIGESLTTPGARSGGPGSGTGCRGAGDRERGGDWRGCHLGALRQEARCLKQALVLCTHRSGHAASLLHDAQGPRP